MRRTEDPRLLAGRGQYVDDITVPKMIEAAVLRSPMAHARITGIDVSRARELPGVFDVITGRDLAAVAGEQPVIWFPIPTSGSRAPTRWPSTASAGSGRRSRPWWRSTATWPRTRWS